jgi:hypothetical protein
VVSGQWSVKKEERREKREALLLSSLLFLH